MSDNQVKQEIIKNYIQSYNSFDINGMLKNLHPDIRFENISGGEVNLITNGIEEFRNQTKQSARFFKEREMKIVDIEIKGEIYEVKIDYMAVLALDFSKELKSGDPLKLKGKSIYKFNGDKIISIQDIS